jgi:hypothetical protein
MSPMRQTQKAPSPKNILDQNKTKEKQHVIAGRAPAMVMMMAIGSQCLILVAIAEVIGLFPCSSMTSTAPEMSLAVHRSGGILETGVIP